MIGKTILQYEILEQLGEGGMGVVYKAQDTKLDRFVALKFLTKNVSSSDSDRQRFMQEAKAAATLNHPNICTIYDVAEHEGQLFIAMEYIDGETLRDRKNNISFKQSIEIGIQVAEALAAAHEKGIVHRDIKPENVMLRKDGLVQIMDFGLAKLQGASRLTREGNMVGTIGYMSPEQVQGFNVDHRTDIFSFGVLLYELISGQSPFKGMHETAIIYEIVNVDVSPMSSVKSEIDPTLDAIVLECLEKDLTERAQSIKQIAVDLKRYKRESSRQRVSRITAVRPAIQPLEPSEGSRQTDGGQMKPSEGLLSGNRIPWIAALLFFVGMTTFAAMYFIRPSVNKTIIRSSLLPPEKSSYSSFRGGGQLALSPDGLKLAFVAMDSSGKNRLWVRALNSLTALPLSGTEEASFPFWSPDNRFIGFFAAAKLKKIEATGGPPSTICDAVDGRGATWNQDGIIVFAPNWIGGVYQVSAAGGAPAAITKLDTSRREQTHRWPSFLPDGKHFLYFARSSAGGAETEADVIYVSSLDGKVNNRLFSASSNIAYASGHILFIRQSAVMAQPFNHSSLALTGEAFPIAEQVGYEINFNRGYFAVSDNGVFVYQTGASTTGSQFGWFDRAGKQLKTVGEPAAYGGGQLSRDEKKLAISVFDPQSRNRDIWIYDLTRGVRTRFTFDQGVEDYPIWSPDGSHIIYSSDKKGHMDIYQKAVNGEGGEELLFESTLDKYPTDWSSDGRFLLYYTIGHPKTKSDVWVLPLVPKGAGGPARPAGASQASGERKPIPLLQTEFEEFDAQFSPDGKWIAYISNESGRHEVYVRPFAGPGGSPADAVRAGKWQISTTGVNPSSLILAARWRRDGKELYYLSDNQKLMVAEVKAAGSSFEVGEVKPLFDTQSKGVLYIAAVSSDGQRFLTVSSLGQSSNPLTLVLNWNEELKKK